MCSAVHLRTYEHWQKRPWPPRAKHARKTVNGREDVIGGSGGYTVTARLPQTRKARNSRTSRCLGSILRDNTQEHVCSFLPISQCRRLSTAKTIFRDVILWVVPLYRVFMERCLRERDVRFMLAVKIQRSEEKSKFFDNLGLRIVHDEFDFFCWLLPTFF
ncbi:hypothetical protein EVAR_31416_1 [Eumeta japonica]|uniref:Uncharacterized protein n=1 Tax=Eumeta variegata TaxID=151549 RepID=A0A4C1UXR8_EUMVA|nr:hypothetical protein EVAR_31416_1 [Eumeta japonica]